MPERISDIEPETDALIPNETGIMTDRQFLTLIWGALLATAIYAIVRH